jgi:uncharacterized protein with NAD-binding domain and iron-sulfur cluster
LTQKIAIFGGGMAGLTAAMGLTHDATRRAAFDITIYQDGWLLGGKGASVRNRLAHGRIEEHGLHLWLGFYENAFRLIREAYGELGRTSDQPLATWQDAFTAWDDVTLMENDGGRVLHWPLKPPRNEEIPGDGDDMPTSRELARRGVKLLLAIVSQTIDHARAARSDSVKPLEGLRTLIAKLMAQVFDVGKVGAVSSAVLLLRWQSQSPGDDPKSLANAFDTVRKKAFAVVAGQIERDPLLRRMWIIFELQLVNLSGMIRDGLLEPDADFAKLDDLDFRDWLRSHGASKMTAESTLVRGLYNLAFSGPDGGAAGTSLLGTMRFLLAYRGALLYRMAAGMGEVVFSPLYLVLRRRGVRFEFFHRAKHFALDRSRTAVERVVLSRQARVLDGEYQPLIDVDGLPCWPELPLFEQLEGGDALRTRVQPGLGNFGQLPEVEQIELRAGRDFDTAILAISLGALPQTCSELIAARPKWKQMVEGVKTIQTVAMQLWFERDMESLGWVGPQPLIGSFEGPHETVADMSHLLSRECWGATAPRALGYFCGTIDDGDAAIANAPLHDRARAESVAWLDAHACELLPAAEVDGRFDRAALFDRNDGAGDARLDAQYFRANTEASDRYVLSVPGSTKLRLWPDESGFSNLVLAGDWTRTGLDAGCIEAAVMSGFMASRSIGGFPERIAGEAPRPRPRRHTATTLPPYIERPHELALRPPYLLTDTKLFSFVLPASRAVLQRRIDEELPHLRGELLAAAPVVVLVAAFAARASSTDPFHIGRGVTPETDIGFWVPVFPRTRGWGLCWYMPFVFVDAQAAMIAGREVYGFPKIIARVERSWQGSTLTHMTVATETIRQFRAGARVEQHTLIELEDVHHAMPRRLPKLAFPTPSVTKARLLFTKQVRDVTHVDRSALSQCVMAESIVRELRDARAMTGTTRIRILRADSHPIVEHLGLAHRRDGDFDVLEARVHGFADFDFTLEPGLVVK